MTRCTYISTHVFLRSFWYEHVSSHPVLCGMEGRHVEMESFVCMCVEGSYFDTIGHSRCCLRLSSSISLSFTDEKGGGTERFAF